MATFDDLKKLRGITFNTFSGYRENVPEFIPITYPETTPEFDYGKISHGLDKDVSEYDPEDLLITSNYWTGSDYSGTTVELSNYEVFLEDYKDLLGTGIFRVYGGYSTFSIAISVRWLLNPDNEERADEIIEVLRDLDGYPVISDDHLSEMESDKEYEAVIDPWLFSECVDQFKDQHRLIIGDGISHDGGLTDDQKWELYRLLSERANEYPIYEDNGPAYIRWEEIVKAWRAGDLTGLNIPHTLTDGE